MKRPLTAVLRTVAALMAAAVMMLCGTACNERELCYDHTHASPVDVEFDWTEAPNAAPVTMVVWFFPTDGSQGRRFELSSVDKSGRGTFNSRLKVPPGTYRVLCHNGTTDNNVEQGSTLDDYVLRTDDDNLLSPLNRADASASAPRPGLTGDEPVRVPASEVWAHTLDAPVTVLPQSSEPVRVRFTPRQMHRCLRITITNVSNLTSDMEISGVITGVAESWSAAQNGPGGAEVTVPFAVRHCGTDCLKADVMIFGDNAPHDVRHLLRLYTSAFFFYDFDITRQMHDADPADPDIRIDLADLVLNQRVSGGIQPGVNGWSDSEDQELVM